MEIIFLLIKNSISYHDAILWLVLLHESTHLVTLISAEGIVSFSPCSNIYIHGIWKNESEDGWRFESILFQKLIMLSILIWAYTF